MRISYWSSDVCSSDLVQRLHAGQRQEGVHRRHLRAEIAHPQRAAAEDEGEIAERLGKDLAVIRGVGFAEIRVFARLRPIEIARIDDHAAHRIAMPRSEEHTSELKSQMRISYAGFCLTNTNKVN